MNRFAIPRLRVLLLAAIGAVLIGGSHGSDAWAWGETPRHETWNWNGTLAAGRHLEINGVNGEIVAVPGAGDRVIVTAEKTGRKHDPAVVKIEVHQNSDGITICAVYPGQASPCRPLGLSFADRAGDVEVDFRVTVPAGVKFEANNVNGAVHVSGLRGPVRARTVNGACDIQTEGSGEASTVNGAVHANVGRLAASDALSLHTVNGSITVTLPADASAEVSGSTVNGSIQSDFPMTLAGRWGPRTANGTLGHGGAHLTASTVNGAIRLQKSGVQ